MGPMKQLAFLFDLDGTLIDSVYQHVLAWREALEKIGMGLPAWIIHRRIGMSGGLIAAALQRETGRRVSATLGQRLQEFHTKAYLKRVDQIRPRRPPGGGAGRGSSFRRLWRR